jgi:Protein of unknown function (DUF4199)
MENNIISSRSKGLMIAATLITLDLILQYRFSTVQEGSRYMARLVISFVGVLAACILFTKQSGNRHFGEVFAHGFKTTALVAFLMAVFTFIAVKYIYPPPTAAEMEAAVTALQQQGNMLATEARQQAEKAAANRWVVYVSLSIFAALIPGVLGALLGGAVARKNA